MMTQKFLLGISIVVMTIVDNGFQQSQYSGGFGGEAMMTQKFLLGISIVVMTIVDNGFQQSQYSGGFGGEAMMTQKFLLGISIVVMTIADNGFQQSQYSGGFGGEAREASSYSDGNANEGSLEETIPGSPGEDYPIFSEVPETSFVCDGQVDGGYYGDPEAECQAFHICA